MEKTLTLKSTEQLKAVMDPLRQRILQALCGAPQTAIQVAKVLGENPTKLYHHVAVLERLGLIELVETKKKRGTTERYYRAVALQYKVSRDLFPTAPGRENQREDKLHAMFARAFDDTLTELRTTIRARIAGEMSKEMPVLLGRSRIRGSREGLEKLRDEIQRALGEFQASADKNGDTEYGLTLAFYPIRTRKPTSRAGKSSPRLAVPRPARKKGKVSR